MNAFVIHIPFLETLNLVDLKSKRFNKHLFNATKNKDQVSFGIFNETLQKRYLVDANLDKNVN